jgi:pimeloyl-ACP methyl ester carboxylesterase
MVNSKYLLLYFHASGEDIKSAHTLLNYIRNSYQINVLAMEYPGYSIYKGSVSAEEINKNAKLVYEFVTGKFGFQERNIIVVGRSIGTGVVLELLKPKPQTKTPHPRCVVLISPFTSIKNLVREFIGKFGTFLAKETYDNLENIAEVKCPVFVVHGRKDSLIPLEHSKDLIST